MNFYLRVKLILLKISHITLNLLSNNFSFSLDFSVTAQIIKNFLGHLRVMYQYTIYNYMCRREYVELLDKPFSFYFV